MRLPAGFDLHTLEVFLLTAELGGMTQCAELLGQTQSAVSQTISRLEIAVGATLFDRSLRPMTLTHEGKMVFERGSKLVDDARGLVVAIRDSRHLPVENITIAMAESMANQLTAPLLTHLGKRAVQWRINSRTSLNQYQDFSQRKFDMLITGNSTLEDKPGFQHLPIFSERFIIALPLSHSGAVDTMESLQTIPFIRDSLQAGMGQRIERQIARLRLKLCHFAEVDSMQQQLAAVAAGLGWTITSPLCIVPHLSLLDQMRLQPMQRGQFARHFQLVARENELGDLPAKIAALAGKVLREVTFPALFERYPWIADTLEWPEE